MQVPAAVAERVEPDTVQLPESTLKELEPPLLPPVVWSVRLVPRVPTVDEITSGVPCAAGAIVKAYVAEEAEL